MPADDLIDRLPRQLRLRELRVFVAVLEHRSFRKAASALHVTQPAVTKSIAGLETLLGVRLFDRVANGVEPTVHGASFAPHARAIFGELRRAALQLDVVSRGATGTLRVGTAPMPASGFLPQALARVAAQQEGVFATVTEAREHELADLLRKREIDIAFVRTTHFPAADDLAVDVLFEESLCVLARRDHPLASSLHLDWSEVVDRQWVMPPADSPFVQLLRRTFERADLPLPRHCVESASIHQQYGMVLHGSLLSFGLRRTNLMASVRDSLIRLPVALPAMTGRVAAVTLRGRETPPLVTLLVEEVRAVTAEPT
ncbi:MAG: LysR substrate-binding domain-containing protein [Burkholderiales bacterium]